MLCFVVAISVQTMAQRSSEYSPFIGIASPPQMVFRSTSAMAYCNSTYSSNPVLDDNGTAVNNAGGAIRKVGGVGGGGVVIIGDDDITDDDDFLPLGDALFPLLIFLIGYVFTKKCGARRIFAFFLIKKSFLFARLV